MGVGVALACKRLDPGQITVAFVGEGAMNEGVTYESMNLAALWQVPVLFVCENNQYGEYTASHRVTAGSIAARAKPYGIRTFEADGMDLRAVREVAARAVEGCRQNSSPAFIEFETYRFSGHHVGDQQKYRPKEEVEQWRARDPIDRLGAQLLAEGGLTTAGLSEIEELVATEVRDAVEFAKESPFPDPSQVSDFVYA
jgi:acetoin:2,6-dichlorophenolindophenol oxidoreductase subunit alpha